jgi:hypothetical protein
MGKSYQKMLGRAATRHPSSRQAEIKGRAGRIIARNMVRSLTMKEEA